MGSNKNKTPRNAWILRGTRNDPHIPSWGCLVAFSYSLLLPSLLQHPSRVLFSGQWRHLSARARSGCTPAAFKYICNVTGQRCFETLLGCFPISEIMTCFAEAAYFSSENMAVTSQASLADLVNYGCNTKFLPNVIVSDAVKARYSIHPAHFRPHDTEARFSFLSRTPTLNAVHCNWLGDGSIDFRLQAKARIQALLYLSRWVHQSTGATTCVNSLQPPDCHRMLLLIRGT